MTDIECPYCGNTKTIQTFEHGVSEELYPELKGISPCYGCKNCREVWGYR